MPDKSKEELAKFFIVKVSSVVDDDSYIEAVAGIWQ